MPGRQIARDVRRKWLIRIGSSVILQSLPGMPPQLNRSRRSARLHNHHMLAADSAANQPLSIDLKFLRSCPVIMRSWKQDFLIREADIQHARTEIRAEEKKKQKYLGGICEPRFCIRFFWLGIIWIGKVSSRASSCSQYQKLRSSREKLCPSGSWREWAGI